MSQTALSGSRTLSARLVDAIFERIQHDKMSPGDHLGTEQDLASEFDISRTVVREAIGTLKGLGIVTSRQRQGIVVAKPDLQPVLSKVLTHSAMGVGGWRELASFRVVVELGAVVLAVKHATAEQIAQLRSLAANMGELVDVGRVAGIPADDVKRAFIERDLQFHDLLLQAADNSLAHQFHQMLVEYFSRGEQFMASPTVLMVEQHRAIVNSLEQRDVLAATRTMTEHMDPVLQLLGANTDQATISSTSR